ncbi:putative folate metabolism gamma-glutamate ligase [soil metagenome]
MKIYAIKTHKVTSKDQDLLAFLDGYLTSFKNGSILAITSKIVAFCQGRIVKLSDIDKQTLIEQEADYFLPPEMNRYHVSLTIKDGRLIPSAGIDESNGDGYHVLWPRQPQATANAVRIYLQQRFACEQVGVVITDSNVTPLRLGVAGVAIAHSGFLALNDYVGTPDLFGRTLRMTKVNVMDALATAAVLVMGEGSEQTPLAMIEDLPFVTFQDRAPLPEELQELHIPMEDDLYGSLLTSVAWQPGQNLH